MKTPKIIKTVNEYFSDFQKSRLITDEILGMSDTRLHFENEICQALFKKKDYSGCNDKERRILHNAYYFILGREMRIISLTFQYLKNIKD